MKITIYLRKNIKIILLLLLNIVLIFNLLVISYYFKKQNSLIYKSITNNKNILSKLEDSVLNINKDIDKNIADQLLYIKDYLYNFSNKDNINTILIDLIYKLHKTIFSIHTDEIIKLYLTPSELSNIKILSTLASEEYELLSLFVNENIEINSFIQNKKYFLDHIYTQLECKININNFDTKFKNIILNKTISAFIDKNIIITKINFSVQENIENIIYNKFDILKNNSLICVDNNDTVLNVLIDEWYTKVQNTTELSDLILKLINNIHKNIDQIGQLE